MLMSEERMLPYAHLTQDFKEAGRLSAEAKVAQQQAHVLAAETLRLQSLLMGLAAEEEGKAAELEELREAVESAQKEAAVAHHRCVCFQCCMVGVGLSFT